MQAAPSEDLRAQSVDADPSAHVAVSEPEILARWIFGLRWTVFVLLAATLPLADRLFGFTVSYPIALSAIAIALIKDIWLRRRGGTSAASGVLAIGVALDLVAMAVVLAASGGAANP